MILPFFHICVKQKDRRIFSDRLHTYQFPLFCWSPARAPGTKQQPCQDQEKKTFSKHQASPFHFCVQIYYEIPDVFLFGFRILFSLNILQCHDKPVLYSSHSGSHGAFPDKVCPLHPDILHGAYSALPLRNAAH